MSPDSLPPPEELGSDRTVVVKPDGYEVVKGRRETGENEYVFNIHIGTADDTIRLIRDPASAIVRNLILESYEIAREHCFETGQLERLREEPWHQYARLLRNALTHNRRWRFSKSDLDLLPTTWNGKTIEASMEGQVITGIHADWYQALELHGAMAEFADSLPR